MVLGTLDNVQRMHLHKITPFQMSCLTQWQMFGLRQRDPKRQSGTQARVRFLSNRHMIKNVRSVYETCQHSRFSLSNRKNGIGHFR